MKIQNSVPSIDRTYYSIDQKWRNSSQRFYLVWLIPDSCSINWNQHSFGRKEFSINWDNEKKWKNSSQRFCLVWLIPDSCSINWNQHSFGRKEFSINWDNEEFHHRVSAQINRFSIPLRSIEKNIQSLERNSRLIETRKIEIFLRIF